MSPHEVDFRERCGLDNNEWAQRDSNPRHLPCKGITDRPPLSAQVRESLEIRGHRGVLVRCCPLPFIGLAVRLAVRIRGPYKWSLTRRLRWRSVAAPDGTVASPALRRQRSDRNSPVGFDKREPVVSGRCKDLCVGLEW